MYPDHINSTSQMASSNYRKYYTIMQLSIYHYLDKLVMNYLFISESTLQQRQVLSNNSIFFFSFLPGVLFGTTMLMVSISLVMAVIVTNLYLRKDSGKRVPYCVRKIFPRKSEAQNFVIGKDQYHWKPCVRDQNAWNWNWQSVQPQRSRNFDQQESL